jgi:ABC-type transport system involved in multi-copper enzyme maturation permease subunit
VTGEVPSAGSTVTTLVGITLRRLLRGKAVWLGAVISGLQVAYAAIVRPYPELASTAHLFPSSMPVLALLPAMFVGASIAEDLDDRTSTYLWSRPIARWTVVAGKLCALTPIVIVLIVIGWFAAIAIATGALPTLASCVALAAGAAATSLVAAGIATVMPRHGMAMTIGYMLLDIFVGAMPFSLRELAITRQITAFAGLASEPPALIASVIAMVVMSGLWLGIGLVRIRRLEV